MYLWTNTNFSDLDNGIAFRDACRKFTRHTLLCYAIIADWPYIRAYLLTGHRLANRNFLPFSARGD